MGSRKRHKRRTRAIIQKGTPPATPPKKPDDKDDDQLYRLTNMEIPLVSLVNAGANRQNSFMVVKQDDAAQKAVPAADADSETKRKAQEARAKQYGIEVKEVGSSLSYPAGSPTTEAMYGDPVNLSYPFGGPNNAVMLGRVRNALARFKQNYETYKEVSSRTKVYERIVRKALAEGVNVSYDSEDPVDKLLPADLKERLSKDAGGAQTAGASTGDDDAAAASQQQKADLDAWIATTTLALQQRQLAAAVRDRLAKYDSLPPAMPLQPASNIPAYGHVGTGDAPPRSAAAGNEAPADQQLRETLAKAKEQEQEIARLRAEARRLRKQRFARIGSASALIAGELTPLQRQRSSDPDDDDMIDVTVRNGENISEKIRKQEERSK
jgi:hypothetical protein